MAAFVPPIPRNQSIGEFLCVHPNRPPIEDIDLPSPLDVKQEAALRALLSLRRLGKPIGDDFVAALDAEPRLARLAYRWAYHDLHRRHRGRGRDPQPPLLRSWSDIILDGPRPSSDPARRTLVDLAPAALLRAIDDDHPGQLLRLWDLGIPGLGRKHTRRALLLMRFIQVLKERHGDPLPARIRQQLRYLRQVTGLPLDTDLL